MSSANYSSDEESVSPSRHKEKEKKMGQKNSILDYFRRSDKPKPEPQPETNISSAAVGSSPKKAEKRTKPEKEPVKYENAHSSSDEYEESWPRPWRNSPERNGSAEKPPDKAEPLKQESEKAKKKTRRKWPRLGRSYSEKDTEDYRKGYPGKRDDLASVANRKFYFNEIPSKPSGDLIDNIHKNWFGNHELLEQHHGYIQWLFPIREHGMNFHSQELQLHEAEAIRSVPAAITRVKESYKLMLDFYGIKLKDEDTGELERADNYRPRFHHLNRSMHNYLRITRILKSLGELGYEHYKAPLVKFILREALEERTLVNCLDSCLDYWVNTIKDDQERAGLKRYAEEYVDDV